MSDGDFPIVCKPDVPRAILLATDLSARSDRALDRALLQARQWQARLVVLTVAEVGLPPRRGAGADAQDALADARRELAETVGGGDVPISMHVETGSVGERILALAEGEGCSLIVTGVARHEALGRAVLGSTVDWLLRHAPVPVLVVRRRPRDDYRSMVLASDWSAPARGALRVAYELFPQTALHVLHGLDVPFHGLLDAGREAAVERLRDQARAEGMAFLRDAGLSPERIADVRWWIERGDPAQLLLDYARQQPLDLVVTGTQGRNALMTALLGSVAARIAETAPVDTLVVRGAVAT